VNIKIFKHISSIKGECFRMKTLTFVIALICLSLLASACTTATPTASGVPSSTATTGVEPTTIPTQTPAPAEPTVPSAVLDLNGLAQAAATLVLPAVQPGVDTLGAVAMPQRTLLWLYGYPITAHVREPQIFIFSVEDLSMYEAAARAAQDLQTLLQSQQEGQTLPFLPLASDVQQMHAQVKFLNFKNGQGVRYLTQYSNGMSPINNQQLFYTFQGLTNDGKSYVAAVLPVSLTGLPSHPTDTANLPLEFTSDYPTYVTSMVNLLNLQAASGYVPDLEKLDALVQSIEVK
jgi:hypothetical protein